jgi:copper homeostasis protein
MPGSGINAGTLRTIINACSPWLGSINRPIQIHLSGGRWVKGNMIYQREEMGMGIPDHEWELWKTVREAIARVHGESFEALT